MLQPCQVEQLDVELKLQSIAKQLTTYIESRGYPSFVMVGVHTGGVWLARRLHELLQDELLQHELLPLQAPLGVLNISYYRDDFTRQGLHPDVKPSQLPFSVEDQHVVLVDDVIMSGRTVRAALNELFDYGRPASVTLVALLDFNARELPIQADIIGETVKLPPGKRVKLTGPVPLRFKVCEYSN